MSRKLVALFLGVMLVFVALALDITYVNATKGEKYERQVLSQTQQSYDSRTIPFQRGNITDRNGTILATSVKVYNVVLDCQVANTTVKDEKKQDTQPYVDPTVAALVEYFGLDETDIRERLTDEKTKESQYQVVARGVSMDAKKAFEAYVDEYKDKKNKDLSKADQAEKAYRAKIRGVWFEESYQRTYPLNSLACDLVGFTYSGDTADWGIEGYYSSILNGVNGRQFGYYNDDADMEQTIIEAQPGKNVVTTIDVNVQKIIRTAIENYNEKINVQNGADESDTETNRRTKAAKNIGVVVMDPNNGEILGMDSSDWYDLNNPRDLTPFYSQEEIDDMNDQETMDALNTIWKNYCISDTYEPGSTAKPMNVAAAYSINAIDDDSLFDCEGFETIAGQMIRCAVYPGAHGLETPADVLKNSCNAGMMQIGQKMGATEFLRYQSIFGFGSRTGIDLPGEAYGLLHDEDSMGPTELATCTFGQGYTVTMIQQAAAFSSLINGGNYYQPHVMKNITDNTGAVVESNEPNLVRQTVSAEISDKLKSFLQRAVREGTGQSAKVAGYTMGGKTGTAQKYPRGDGKYLVSFLGFAPVENPKAVVYVVVDEPDVEDQANSVLAQEIAKEIYSELLPYLNVFPDDTDGVTGEGSETGAEDPNVSAPLQSENTQNSTENGDMEDGGLTNGELDLINEE